MADNATGAFGLRPLRHRHGAPYNGATVPCYIASGYATALFVGDPVMYTSETDDQDPTGKMPSVIVATLAAGNLYQGVIVSFEPLQTDLTKVYNPASTARVANVCFDEDIVYAVRGDGGGTLTKLVPGQNALLIATAAGSTTTGLSGMHLDEGTGTAPTTTQNLPLHILNIQPKEDNTLGDNMIYEVVLNTPLLAAGKVIGITAS